VDSSDISQETITVVQRIIKEILRQTNQIMSEKNASTECASKEGSKVTENFIKLSVLMNCFGIVILRRYSVLMPFILKFNLVKVIKTLGSHGNLLNYLLPSKKEDFAEQQESQL
jgi:hypothetical protein